MSRIGGVVREVVVTPVAVPEPPLLFAGGLHEPWTLRTIVEIRCEDGTTGLGETYGDERVVELLRRLAPALVGLDVADLAGLDARVRVAAAPVPPLPDVGAPGAPSVDRTLRILRAPLELACLDAHGQRLGRSVADLLGGRRRDEVPFAGYLFFRWKRHPGAPPDDWGPALDAAGIVEQARRMRRIWGFRSFKLKGGVLPPTAETAAVLALRAAFPEAPLRLDPNGAWGVATSIAVARDLEGVLEYLEDPTDTAVGTVEVARATTIPLATNTFVLGPEDLAPAVASGMVAVVLGDLHYWGGAHAIVALAGRCADSGLGLSMHSSAHLGISLAAMLQVGAALPTLEHAFDTHWPWHTADVVAGDPFRFHAGSVAVPDGPGLGVRLDPDALARAHAAYAAQPARRHHHARYRRRHEPGFEVTPARW